MSALCYLDSIQYMIHRDIAARNFLVTQNNNIKLADFGRARFVYDDDYEAARSEMISIKWSSPEVLLKSRYSTRSDLWAAGVVMWEVLTRGQRPYSDLSAEQTVLYVLNGGRLECPENCPQRLYSVMASCWRRTPTDRPSCTQLANRLHEISVSVAVDQQPVSDVMSHGSLRRQLTSSSAAAATTSRLERRRGTCTDLQIVDERCSASSSASSPSASSSSCSVRGPSGVTAASSADDLLTRRDNIRQSLRKLVNMRL